MAGHISFILQTQDIEDRDCQIAKALAAKGVIEKLSHELTLKLYGMQLGIQYQIARVCAYADDPLNDMQAFTHMLFHGTLTELDLGNSVQFDNAANKALARMPKVYYKWHNIAFIRCVVKPTLMHYGFWDDDVKMPDLPEGVDMITGVGACRNYIDAMQAYDNATKQKTYSHYAGTGTYANATNNSKKQKRKMAQKSKRRNR